MSVVDEVETALSAADTVLSILKGAAAVARMLGVGEGEIADAVSPAEARAIDLEVDALEEEKLRGKGGG